MATNNQSNPIQRSVDAVTSSPAAKKVEDSPVVQKGVNPLKDFFTKYNNDWVMNLQAGALSYSMLVAIVPILIAILSIIGLVLGSLGPDAQTQLINSIGNILPKEYNAQSAIHSVISSKLPSSSGLILIIAIIVAVFGGSRLFITIENCFDIIYHQRPRTFLKQNIMAIGMLLIFTVLIPVMLLASTIPAFLDSTALKNFPGGSIALTIIGILFSVLISWLFFEAIYIIIPNQHISFRNSWRGALFAAIAVQIYLSLFTLYASKFLSGYAAQVGFALMLIAFFYYFAVILLLGAEVNAFFGEGIQKTPDNLAGLIHTETSHDPKLPEEQRKQAPPSHKEAMSGGAHADDWKRNGEA